MQNVAIHKGIFLGFKKQEKTCIEQFNLTIPFTPVIPGQRGQTGDGASPSLTVPYILVLNVEDLHVLLHIVLPSFSGLPLSLLPSTVHSLIVANTHLYPIFMSSTTLICHITLSYDTLNRYVILYFYITLKYVISSYLKIQELMIK